MTNKLVMTVDHAYDGGSRIEMIWTGRITTEDLVEIVGELAQGFNADIIMSDSRGPDYRLHEFIEEQLALIEYTPPVIQVSDASAWADRLWEAKELLK